MFTTRLLEALDDRMPHRHQVIVAVLIVFISLASIAGSVSRRPAVAVQPTPQVIILIATPTVQPAMGLAKRAARIGPVAQIATSPAPTPAPAPVILVAPVEADPPTATPTPSPEGPTGNPPRWTIR